MVQAIHIVHTITKYNGREFADHEAVASALNTDIYFAHPYSSWEKGLNENTNGLIRQDLPKGVDLSEFSPTDLNQIAISLNTRPRSMSRFPDAAGSDMRRLSLYIRIR